jgi:hypothetical protein
MLKPNIQLLEDIEDIQVDDPLENISSLTNIESQQQLWKLQQGF